MLVHVQNLLNGEQLKHFRQRLEAPEAPWVDGRVTAGHQGVHVKQNQQIAEGSAVSAELGGIVLAALERLLAEKGVASRATQSRYRDAWQHACERTPHGKSIDLSAEDFY